MVKQITSQWVAQNKARDRDGTDDDDCTFVDMGKDSNMMAVEAKNFNYLRISNKTTLILQMKLYASEFYTSNMGMERHTLPWHEISGMVGTVEMVVVSCWFDHFFFFC